MLTEPGCATTGGESTVVQPLGSDCFGGQLLSDGATPDDGGSFTVTVNPDPFADLLTDPQLQLGTEWIALALGLGIVLLLLTWNVRRRLRSMRGRERNAEARMMGRAVGWDPTHRVVRGHVLSRMLRGRRWKP